MLRAYRVFVMTSIIGLWLGFFFLAYTVNTLTEVGRLHNQILGHMIEDIYGIHVPREGEPVPAPDPLDRTDTDRLALSN